MWFSSMRESTLDSEKQDLKDWLSERCDNSLGIANRLDHVRARNLPLNATHDEQIKPEAQMLKEVYWTLWYLYSFDDKNMEDTIEIIPTKTRQTINIYMTYPMLDFWCYVNDVPQKTCLRTLRAIFSYKKKSPEAISRGTCRKT